MGAHLDLTLGVSGALRGEQARAQNSASHSRHYPKTHNPQPQIHISFCEQWRGAKDVSSGAFGARAGPTYKHQEFSWECCSHQVPIHEKLSLGTSPSALPYSSCPTAEAGSIFSSREDSSPFSSLLKTHLFHSTPPSHPSGSHFLLSPCWMPAYPQSISRRGDGTHCSKWELQDSRTA